MEVDETLPATTPASSGKSLAVGVQAGGRYKVLRFVAAGAMGEVYAAEDLIIGTTVALKVLRAELQGSSNAIARLRREIALARQVTDVHVCRVHDVGEHEGRVFLTMELLEGKTLADHLAASGPLSIAEVERLARQLVAGLAALHRTGIVHRDFKLANTMLVGERLVITDFGLARSAALESSDANLTAEAAVLGTPAYMAPEQAQGKPATAASDIYALGIVLFELLTGKRPFTGDSAMGIATARLTQDPPRPSTLRAEIPARWDAIVLRCLEREPAARFSRVADVLGDPGRPARSRRTLAIGVAIALAAAVSTVFAVTRGGSAPEPRDATIQRAITQRAITAFDGRVGVSTVAMTREGSRIAYHAGSLWLRDLGEDHQATRVDLSIDTSGLRVYDFFPDGHRLLVKTEESDGPALQILDLRDRSLRPWRRGSRVARLSPGADRVAYFGPEGVTVAPLEGTGERVLYPFQSNTRGYQMAWSADGKWLAVVIAGSSSLQILATDGSTRGDPVPHAAGGVVWSGSDRLVYARLVVRGVGAGVEVATGTDLCEIGVVGGAWDRQTPRCFRTLPDAQLDWFHLAGGRLVLIKNVTSYTVETVALDTSGIPIGARTPLPDQEGASNTWGFTPDGSVMGIAARQGPAQVSLQRPGEPTARLLAPGDGYDDFPIADGDAVVFMRAKKTTCELIRQRGKHQETIASETLPTPDPRETPCPYLRCSATTPTRCVSIRFTGASFVVRRFDLSTGREVGTEHRRASTGNVTTDLSRDGKTLAWGISDALALLDVDTGAYRELRPKGLLQPHDVSWLPGDGGWLVAGPAPTSATPVIVRMRPDGTYDVLITDTRAVAFHNPYLSHDGKTISLLGEYTRNDVVLLEGL